MTTINEKVKAEIKNWLDKNIDSKLRESDEVVKLSNDATDKVILICESKTGYKLGLTDTEIINTVNNYFVNFFYNN